MTTAFGWRTDHRRTETETPVPERQFLAKLPPTAARLLRVAHDLTFARDLATVVVTARKAARELTGADGVTIKIGRAHV